MMVLIFFIVVSFTYPPKARFAPLVILLGAVSLSLIELLSGHTTSGNRIHVSVTGKEVRQNWYQNIVLWIVLLVVSLYLFGFFVGIPLFIMLFLKFRSNEGWLLSLGVTALATIAFYFGFVEGLKIIFPPGLLFAS